MLCGPEKYYADLWLGTATLNYCFNENIQPTSYSNFLVERAATKMSPCLPFKCENTIDLRGLVFVYELQIFVKSTKKKTFVAFNVYHEQNLLMTSLIIYLKILAFIQTLWSSDKFCEKTLLLSSIQRRGYGLLSKRFKYRICSNFTYLRKYDFCF